MDCKSVIRRFESDLGLSEIPAVSGVSDTSNESANKPELPDESRTNGPLSCGLVVAFGFIAGYLRRYTPLPRPAAPIKRSPLPRSRKPIAKMSKRGQRRAAKWRESGMVAFAASGGMCVRCLIRPAMHRHHKRKRRAGDDTPGNCCPLCELCHCFVEEHPKEAAAEGFVVSVNQSPLAKGAAA